MKTKLTMIVMLAALCVAAKAANTNEVTAKQLVRQALYDQGMALVATNAATTAEKYRLLLASKLHKQEVRQALRDAIQADDENVALKVLLAAAKFVGEVDDVADVDAALAELDAVPVPANADKAAWRATEIRNRKIHLLLGAGRLAEAAELLEAKWAKSKLFSVFHPLHRAYVALGDLDAAQRVRKEFLLEGVLLVENLAALQATYRQFATAQPSTADHIAVLERLCATIPVTPETKLWLAELWSKLLLLKPATSAATIPADVRPGVVDVRPGVVDVRPAVEFMTIAANHPAAPYTYFGLRQAAVREEFAADETAGLAAARKLAAEMRRMTK
jgi:hypothetical protein